MRQHSLDRFFFYAGLAIALGPVLIGLHFNPYYFYSGTAVLLLASLSLCRRGSFFSAAGGFLGFFSAKCFGALWVLSAALWTILLVLKYYSLGYHTFDTGIYAQLLAGFAATNRFANTFTLRHGLADHFCPNLILLYPFFKLYPTFAWLIAFKLLAFLSCPFLLLHFGRKIIGPGSRLIYAAPLLFLLHSYLANAMAFEFQPSALALPFIILAFILANDGKTVPALITLLILAGFKEQLPLVWISLAMFLITEKKQLRLASSLIAAAIVLGLLLHYLVIPYFNLDPRSMRAYLVEPAALLRPKLQMLFLGFASVGFLPLLAPRTLLLILPAFALALLSNVPAMQTFDYHYQDLSLILLFVGMVIGLAEFEHQQSWLCRYSPKMQELFFAAGILALVLCSSRWLTTSIAENIPSGDELALVREARRYAAAAPRNVDLWVAEPLSVFFVGHPRLRSFDQYKRGPFEAALEGELPRTWPVHVVVLTDQAETSSLPAERYEEVKQGLAAGMLTGKYKQLEGFSKLRVYTYSSP